MGSNGSGDSSSSVAVVYGLWPQ